MTTPVGSRVSDQAVKVGRRLSETLGDAVLKTREAREVLAMAQAVIAEECESAEERAQAKIFLQSVSDAVLLLSSEPSSPLTNDFMTLISILLASGGLECADVDTMKTRLWKLFKDSVREGNTKEADKARIWGTAVGKFVQQSWGHPGVADPGQDSSWDRMSQAMADEQRDDEIKRTREGI